MIDSKLLRQDAAAIAARLQSRGYTFPLDEYQRLEDARKTAQVKAEQLQAQRNSLSAQIGQAKKKGENADALMAQVAALDSEQKDSEQHYAEIQTALDALLATVPNPPHESVPVGKDEDDNICIKTVLEPRKFDFSPKEHWELGESLGWLDFERGAKLSGSRFTVLRGMGARLSRALVNYMIDFNSARGFELVNVPYLVNSNTLFGTGQLPKFEDDLYKVRNEDLYLIPTSEVPVTNLYNDTIIEGEQLPIKMTCYSACFRQEAGSAGRDTRGMIRQHQFEKVELVSITKPDQSEAVLDEMISCASDLLTSLGLPHRHMLLCSGDLGFSAAKTVDLEVWLPGQGKYREISSISNTRDFQARRAKIRFKDGKKNMLVNTLNGSSLAVGRTLIAIMENYQKADGSIEIPAVLKRYM